ncbi:MAG: hypothetical protein JNK00_02720 [Flavipsychrobacter sp.]|nr:hypothetical protein [Flavipsychrobacter sp.]
MSKEQLKHIFDQSSCLTKKQLKGYVSGSMTNEEVHAVEVHLNSCPMCSDAVDGLFAEQEGGFAAMSKVNTDFLKEHFGNSNPQIHLNNVVPGAVVKAKKPTPAMMKAKSTRSYFAFRVTSVAATILLAMAAIWYYRLTQDVMTENSTIAQELSQPETNTQQPALPDNTETLAAIPVADSTSVPVQSIIQESSTTQDEGVVAMAEDMSAKEKPGLLKRLGNKVETIAAKKTTEKVLGAIKNNDPDKYATSAKNQFVEDQKKKNKEEIAVSAYKVPLIGEDERKVITADEIEKMPTRNTGSMTATAALEDVKLEKIEQADKLFQAGKLNDALSMYTQEMRNAKNKGKRQQAAIGAVRCYIVLGNKYKAKDILRSIVDEGGPYKREAKRMLKEMGWEE